MTQDNPTILTKLYGLPLTLPLRVTVEEEPLFFFGSKELVSWPVTNKQVLVQTAKLNLHTLNSM